MSMSRPRRAARHYARAYLGVNRLPKGLPAVLDALVGKRARTYPNTAHLARILAPYRKPWTGL